MCRVLGLAPRGENLRSDDTAGSAGAIAPVEPLPMMQFASPSRFVPPPLTRVPSVPPQLFPDEDYAWRVYRVECAAVALEADQVPHGLRCWRAPPPRWTTRVPSRRGNHRCLSVSPWLTVFRRAAVSRCMLTSTMTFTARIVHRCMAMRRATRPPGPRLPGRI